jgi:beta-N-acetylhexosaminidase
LHGQKPVVREGKHGQDAHATAVGCRWRAGGLTFGTMADLERAVAGMFAVGYEGKTLTPSLGKLLDRGVNAVALFSRNVESPQQVAKLCFEIQKHAQRPILIAVDQEGGRVARLREGFTPLPSMRAVGASGDEKLAEQIGRLVAAELAAVGISMNFAPVMDVDSNPANPVIGDRSFGSDAAVVANMGVAMLKGLQAGGVAACAKHFPGHGDTSKDSHFDLPSVSHPLARLLTVELPPFAAAIEAGVSAIMSAHVVFDAIDPENPATLSAAILSHVLRGELKFAGVVFSDALEMKAIADRFPIEETVIRGANAGLDVLAICEDPDLQNRAIDALSAGLRAGKVKEESVINAYLRIERLIKQYVQPAKENADLSVLNSVEHHAIVEKIASVISGPDPTERAR